MLLFVCPTILEFRFCGCDHFCLTENVVQLNSLIFIIKNRKSLKYVTETSETKAINQIFIFSLNTEGEHNMYVDILYNNIK